MIWRPVPEAGPPRFLLQVRLRTCQRTSGFPRQSLAGGSVEIKDYLQRTNYCVELNFIFDDSKAKLAMFWIDSFYGRISDVNGG